MGAFDHYMQTGEIKRPLRIGLKQVLNDEPLPEPDIFQRLIDSAKWQGIEPPITTHWHHGKLMRPTFDNTYTKSQKIELQIELRERLGLPQDFSGKRTLHFNEGHLSKTSK